MKKFWKEFKQFISRGNVFDIAIGLIIATAFNKIVSSLVNDIIMPLITFLTGASSLAELSVPLRWTEVDGVKTVSLAWNYGAFCQTIIDFLIIAFSVFVAVKIVSKSQQKFQEVNGMFKKNISRENIEAYKRIKEQAKAEQTSFKKLWKEYQEKQAELEKQKQEEAKKLAEEKALKEKLENPTTEELLKQILAELKKKQ